MPEDKFVEKAGDKADKTKIKKKNNTEEISEEQTIEKTEEMKQYEQETGRYSVWRGVVTEGFKRFFDKHLLISNRFLIKIGKK